MPPPSKKKAITIPQSSAQLVALVGELNLAHVQKAKIEAEAEEAKIKAEQAFAERLEATKKTINEGLRLLKAWALANRQTEFKDEAKSLEILGCRFGWKTGNPATDVADGTEWEDVTTMLLSLRTHGEMADSSPAEQELGALAASLLRDVVEPNKAEMIARREDTAVMSLLKSIGVTISAKERFFFEPSLEPTARTLNA
jgi:phage host-nuclease inhibitor protein Gam